MTDYIPPYRDMLFAINELAGLDRINQLPGLEEATADLVAQLLDEAGRMASEVLAPLNQTGDTTGASIKNREVHPPQGFKEAYKLFVESGWPTLPFAAEIGGQGLPFTVATATNEMWQSANLAWSLCPMLSEGAVTAIETYGTDALKAQYLPKIITGEWSATMNLTESQAGSDLSDLKTRAVPNGDHYLLSGQKIFITWGDHDFSENIIHLVLARLPDAPPGTKGISLFLVPKYLINADGTLGERNDVYPVSIEHKLGIHGSPTCVMSYGDDGGAVGYLVGEEHSGLACMFSMMNQARLAVGLEGLSVSERAYQHALAYARERVQGRGDNKEKRVTIIHHPDVRRMLMLMKSGTEAMRALCYTTAASIDYIHHAGDENIKKQHESMAALLTPIVKGWCTELAQELASLGVQIHGGMGYIEETGAAQYLRDARITTIYEGTTGIQAMDLIGRKILRDNGATLTLLIKAMRTTLDALSKIDTADIKTVHAHLKEGIEAIEQAMAWLSKGDKADPHTLGAVAVNLLMLIGTVCGGWQMARSALIAHDRINADQDEDGFHKDKIITARFYAEHILSRGSSYLQQIQAGSESIMAIDFK